jgi:hypothetical protein
MTPRRAFGMCLILAMTLVLAACDGGAGIGISAGYPSSYWGGGTTGPGVFTAGMGGPVYR